jgi:hypothetical protein
MEPSVRRLAYVAAWATPNYVRTAVTSSPVRRVGADRLLARGLALLS